MGNRQSKADGGGSTEAGGGGGGAAAAPSTSASPTQQQQAPVDRSQADTTPLSARKGSRGTPTKWHLGPGGAERDK
jgi:hypothetical protein